MSEKELEFVSAYPELDKHQQFVLNLINEGKTAWNGWRKENPKESINLSNTK